MLHGLSMEIIRLLLVFSLRMEQVKFIQQQILLSMFTQRNFLLDHDYAKILLTNNRVSIEKGSQLGRPLTCDNCRRKCGNNRRFNCFNLLFEKRGCQVCK